MEYKRALEIIDGKMLRCACRAEISTTRTEDSRINEEYNFLCCARDAIEHLIPESYEQVSPGIYRCRRCGYAATNSKFCPECGQRSEVPSERPEISIN